MAKTIILVPTYNEKSNISLLLEKIFEILPGVSILVIDDNSPDGTGEAVKELQTKFQNLSLLTNPKKEGLGMAYIKGFKRALQEKDIAWLVMMDADFSHQPKYLPALLKEKEKYGLVIGSRYIKGGGITERWEWWRKLLSRGANFYCRMLLNRQISDWTGGFNCLEASLLKKINFEELKFSGYAFIISLKYYLLKAGAKPKEIPIFFKERLSGQSKISNKVIKEGIIAPWKLIFKNIFQPKKP